MKKKKSQPKERSYFYEMNKIFLGDCIDVLRNKLEIPDESVDLIYIDPPFNSNRDYAIFFDQDDSEIRAQHIAFTDTWSLKNVAEQLVELDTLQTEELKKLLDVYQVVARHAFPYLLMMALRIVELHKILRETGSFYLHCDPTMSHYLKTICDIIFGHKHFRNEIAWHYSGWNAKLKNSFNSRHDIILFYGKSDKQKFNSYGTPWASKEEYVKVRKQKIRIDDDDKREYVLSDAGGGKRVKRYLDEAMKDGRPVDDVWSIDKLNNSSAEKLEYPTQKPLALLRRIIESSTDKGDVVLDAFCGCGTTVDAAEELGRKWIGIDISPVSVNLIRKRLADKYKSKLGKIIVRGMPVNLESAQLLAKENPNAFQDWWVLQYGALSPTYGKSGADLGVDGIAKYRIGLKGETINIGFQVKATSSVGRPDLDNFLGVMQKQKYPIGVFLTLSPPSKTALEMVGQQEPVEILGVKYPKIQIITLDDFWKNIHPKLPSNNITFNTAQRRPAGVEQEELDM